MKNIFISHSCKDHQLVGELKSILYHPDWKLIIDPFSPGDKTCTKVQSCIKNSTHFILLYTSNALKSYWVQLEALFAQLCFKQDSIIYLPISVDNSPIPETAREIIHLNINNNCGWNSIKQQIIDIINKSKPNNKLDSDIKISDNERKLGRAFERRHAETNNAFHLHQAVSSYQSAINYNFCNHNAWANLAWCLQKLFEDNRAKKTIDIAMQISPDSNHIMDVKERIYSGQRRIS